MGEDDVRDAVDNSNVVALPRAKFTEDYIHRLNQRYALVIMGSQAVIMRENGPDAPPWERLQFLAVSAFKDIHRKDQFKFGDRWRGGGDLWLEHPLRRDYDGLEFAPGAEARPNYFNLWSGYSVEPSKDGDCTLFLAHIEENAARGSIEIYDWIMSWFASIIQRPLIRYGTSLTLRGKQGTGKTIIGEQIGKLFGPHYVLLDSPHLLVGHFNAHMKQSLLVQADEGFWAGDKQAEGRLKSLVTAETHMVEGKGVNAVMMPNYIRLMVTSNDDWVVPAGDRERRFAVFDMGEDHIQDHKYFAALTTQLETENGYARLLWELQNWRLDDALLRRIPRTEALWEQKQRSMDSAAQWLFHRLRHGEMRISKGWEDWIATMRLHGSYRHYCEQHGEKRPFNEVHLMRRLKKFLPDIEARRGSRGYAEEDADLPERPMGYAFPSLDRARETFAAEFDYAIIWED